MSSKNFDSEKISVNSSTAGTSYRTSGLLHGNSRRSSTGTSRSRSSSVLRNRIRRSSLYNRNEDNHPGEPSSAPQSRDIKVPIVGYEIMEKRTPFTVFKLRIENEELNENWLVCRRYTDFERLHTKLKEEFPDLNVSLPPKRWLKSNFDAEFLEDRMKGLQAYVDSILVQPKLLSSQTVRAFFCLYEPPLYFENPEESRTLMENLEDAVEKLEVLLSERDAEIEFLKSEVALLRLQNDALTKIRGCSHCIGRRSGHQSRQTIVSTPVRNDGESGPFHSTPNGSRLANGNLSCSSSSISSSNANHPLESIIPHQLRDETNTEDFNAVNETHGSIYNPVIPSASYFSPPKQVLEQENRKKISLQNTSETFHQPLNPPSSSATSVPSSFEIVSSSEAISLQNSTPLENSSFEVLSPSTPFTPESSEKNSTISVEGKNFDSRSKF